MATGVEREHDRVLKGAAQYARRRFLHHMKVCSQCHNAQKDENPFLYCKDGFDLGSEESRTRIDLIRWQEQWNITIPEQGVLF